MSGRSLIDYGNGKVYYGQIDCHTNYFFDIPHGTGKIIYPDGDTYRGNFINGERSGYGIYTENLDILIDRNKWLHDIDINSTQWEKAIFKDGRICDGQWLNNQMNGFGISKKFEYNKSMTDSKCFDKAIICHNSFRSMKLNKTITYEGEWFEGKKNGRGILTIIEESPENNFNFKLVYVGEWIDNKMNGIFEVYRDGVTVGNNI